MLSLELIVSQHNIFKMAMASMLRGPGMDSDIYPDWYQAEHKTGVRLFSDHILHYAYVFRKCFPVNSKFNAKDFGHMIRPFFYLFMQKVC